MGLHDTAVNHQSGGQDTVYDFEQGKDHIDLMGRWLFSSARDHVSSARDHALKDGYVDSLAFRVWHERGTALLGAPTHRRP